TSQWHGARPSGQHGSHKPTRQNIGAHYQTLPPRPEETAWSPSEPCEPRTRFGVVRRRARPSLVARHPGGLERRRGPHAGISWLGSTWYQAFTRSIMSLTAAGSSGWNVPVSWNRNVAPFASTCGSATHA